MAPRTQTVSIYADPYETMVNLRLDHLYMPAKKPEWLAEWYAETFNFLAKDGFVQTGEVMLVFQEGVPVHHHDRAQFGFRCDDRAELAQLANTLGAEIHDEGVFCSFMASDPEGYRFEVYWEGTAE